MSLGEQAKVSHSGPTWPRSRRDQNSKDSSCAARALTFNEPKPGPPKSSARKKRAFRVHGALVFSRAQFLNSRQATFLRVTSRRHGTALVIWVFSGRPGLAAGCPQILCWSIPAQGVFLGGPIHPKQTFL